MNALAEVIGWIVLGAIALAGYLALLFVIACGCFMAGEWCRDRWAWRRVARLHREHYGR